MLGHKGSIRRQLLLLAGVPALGVVIGAAAGAATQLLSSITEIAEQSTRSAAMSTSAVSQVEITNQLLSALNDSAAEVRKSLVSSGPSPNRPVFLH